MLIFGFDQKQRNTPEHPDVYSCRCKNAGRHVLEALVLGYVFPNADP